uniref:ATP synthase F0 subunit 8 n=1 Tax=Sminthurinus signatus TaxID=2584529 RepID=A0A6H0EY38_9HEXA|nr:ATP synthase F0 subunit 8 [Sminthurinus signatus]
MPQMWPMQWEILFLVSMMLIITLMTNFFFMNSSFKISINEKKNNLKKKIMKW